MSLTPLSRYQIAHVIAAPNASSEEPRQQNQVHNFHGRCPQLDGREVVHHKPVTELLDAEKVLKSVEFCAPAPSSVRAGRKIHLFRPGCVNHSRAKDSGLTPKGDATT